MLSLLKIRNLALVDELSWQPYSGFLGITGETGAGKSVIMGAIELVQGERADKGLIRAGETQCSIEAVFDLPRVDLLNQVLEAAGVPLCEDGQLLIRRQISASSNKQFINNCPVTLQLLRQVGAGLVDMHHPEAHRSLSSPQRQLELLDAFGTHAQCLQHYKLAYTQWSEAKQAHKQLLESEMANARELDFLRHQVEEIESAEFSAEEVQELEARWQRARNASRLRDTAAPMLHILQNDEQGVLTQMRQVVRLGHELERLDSTVEPWMRPLAASIEELEELSAQLGDYLDGMEGDPAALMELENRIARWDSLKRKYGADFETVANQLAEFKRKLAAIEQRDDMLAQLEAAEQKALAGLMKQGKALSKARKAAQPKLEASFLGHAQQLGFLQAHFAVELQELASPSPSGLEEAEFLFGPNPGEPLKPLRMIASSGELARVMLALKSALAKQDDTPLLVFDEIDANVGGEIARAVGRKMRELGQDHQVIAITHFPQVAALADHHYLITKVQEGGRSLSRLNEVQGEPRVKELVRMLGTDGESAYAHARDLLKS